MKIRYGCLVWSIFLRGNVLCMKARRVKYRFACFGLVRRLWKWRGTFDLCDTPHRNLVTTKSSQLFNCILIFYGQWSFVREMPVSTVITWNVVFMGIESVLSMDVSDMRFCHYMVSFRFVFFCSSFNQYLIMHTLVFATKYDIGIMFSVPITQTESKGFSHTLPSYKVFFMLIRPLSYLYVFGSFYAVFPKQTIVVVVP